jgi:two-component system, NtrC family, sensor kinase
MLTHLIQRIFPQGFPVAIGRSQSSSQSSSQSISQKTLMLMAARVAGIVLVSTGLTYVHHRLVMQTQVQDELAAYIAERGRHESLQFQRAEQNLNILQSRLLADLQQTPSPLLDREFTTLFSIWTDRTRRNFPQDRPFHEFDTDRHPTASIGRTAIGDLTPITPELQHRVMTAYQLVGQYGSAWSEQFADLYYVSPENININYWKGVPSSLTAKSDLYHPNEEYFYIADPKNNPDRKAVWTGVYLDPSVKIWMVSAILPVYQGDRFLGVVGHDLVLTEFLAQTINNHRSGTLNLIVRGDGRLIAHPDYTEKIQQAQGQLAIESTQDPHLARIFNTIQNMSGQPVVLDHPDDDEFIAVTKLPGPDWYFVTIYPKSLMAETAFSLAKFVLWSGLLVLVVEVALLASVLRDQISRPLRQLTDASNDLADGTFEVNLDLQRRDELGTLARSFSRMSEQLKVSFGQLEEANADLEHRVLDRTAELEKTVRELHLAQAQMVQSEKMSALGQLVAGIAHEINNPISFIHGNLVHVKAYMQDLLGLVQLYHTHLPVPPEAIASRREEIDVDFLTLDVEKMLRSMNVGTTRIREIVLSLRTFSRLDESESKVVDIHHGLDSAVMILRHRLVATIHRPEIKVIQQYGSLPYLECFAGQLNQVFLNVLSNAIDVLDEIDFNSLNRAPQIIITTQPTRFLTGENVLLIRIEDNGPGIPEDVRAQVFDPFFTTKPVGQGTGMGLAIAHQIVVEKHRGTIEVESAIDDWTAIVIQLPI